MFSKRPIAIALCLSLVLAGQSLAAGTRTADQTDLIRGLNGSPVYLGRIAATTSAKNNADATAFTIPPGSLLLIISSAAVSVLGDKDATEDVTATTGVPLAANEKFYLLLRSDQAYLQVITPSSTANVDVWRLE